MCTADDTWRFANKRGALLEITVLSMHQRANGHAEKMSAKTVAMHRYRCDYGSPLWSVITGWLVICR